MSEVELSNDVKFMSHIIEEICDYAVDNNMNPNETMETIANNLLTILSISTFENWEGVSDEFI
jgi:hypothetical protein